MQINVPDFRSRSEHQGKIPQNPEKHLLMPLNDLTGYYIYILSYLAVFLHIAGRQ